MPSDYRAPFLHSEREGICLLYGVLTTRWPPWRRRWRWWIAPRTYPAYAAVTLAHGWAWTKLGALLAGKRARRRALRDKGF